VALCTRFVMAKDRLKSIQDWGTRSEVGTVQRMDGFRGVGGMKLGTRERGRLNKNVFLGGGEGRQNLCWQRLPAHGAMWLTK
jgi:hypothetical protein